MRKEFRYDILLVNVDKTDSIEIFLRHMHYLTLLCENYKQDHGMAVLLDGYIQYHKTICQNEGCFSRKDFKSSKKIQKILDFGYDEQLLRVTYMINSYFTVMLQKKPYNSALRVQYALFLLDKLNQKQLALQEIVAAAGYKPSLSEQFMIFRLKKIIENELLDKKKEEKVLGLGFDSINELALNSLVKIIKNNVERAASFHLEFWSQLSEDVPDLSKLFEIGNKISAVVTVLEEDWERLQRMNVVLPSLYRNYASFLYSVLNDKPSSVKIYNKIEAQNLQGIQQNSLKTTVVSEYVNNSTPVLFISGEEATLGNILSLNQTAAALLGYNKSELINKKINMIQPNSIAQSHDQYIENFLLRNEAKILNKETLLPVKNRNGFLSALYFFARFVPFALQGLQFFAIVRPEKTFKNYLYLFCAGDGSIELISSSCVGVLAVDKKKLMKRKHYITQVIPSFFDKLASFQGKNGGFADVHVQTRKNHTISQYTTTLAASLHVQKEVQRENSGEESSQILSSNEISNVNIEEDEAINKSKSNINDENNNNNMLYATNTISRNDNVPITSKKTPKEKEEETVIPCSLPINVFTLENKDFSLLSYLVRIEYKEQASVYRVKKNKQQLQPPDTKNVRNPQVFSFLFDVSSQCYKGELLEGQDLEIDEYLNQLKSSYSNRNNDVNMSSFPDDFRVSSEIRNEGLNKDSLIYKKFEENMLMKQKELQNSNYEFIDFGKGIKTYRLLGDRAYDIEELKREEEEDNSNSEENSSEKLENLENFQKTHKEKEEETSVETNINLKNSRNIFRNRGNFFTFLKKAKSEKNYFVSYLQIISGLVLVLLGILASVNHFLLANQTETNQTSYNLIEWSNERISQTQMVLFYSMELFLLNKGLYSKKLQNNENSYEVFLRYNLNSSILLLENLQNQIILNSFGLNSEHKKLVLENSINVNYLSFNGNVLNQSFDINQITSQIISKAYSLVSKALNCFNSSDSDFFYLQYNLLNDYYLALRQENSYFFQELQDRFSSNFLITLIMIILSAILLISSILILAPLYTFALTIHHKILMIFLEISPDINKKILTKTEGFVNHLQIGETEEEILSNHSSEKSIAENEEDFEEFAKKKRRKKFKFNNFVKFLFFFKLFFISFAIEAFFIANYFVTTYYLQTLDNLSPEINATSISESYFSFANNALRQNIIQQDFSMINLNNSSGLVSNLSEILINLASEIEKQHSLAQNSQDPQYNSAFIDIFTLNLCDFFVKNKILEENSRSSCDNFADGSLTQGLSLSFYRFIDNFRDLAGYISLIRSGELTDLTEISPNISNFYVDLLGISSKTYNNLMNLLSLQQQEENNNFTNIYLVNSLRFLTQIQLDALKQSYTNTMNSRLILFICFIIFLFIVYLFFWMPVIYQLNNNLYKIKKMLAIIPIEVINSNGNIKDSIEFFLNIHE